MIDKTNTFKRYKPGKSHICSLAFLSNVLASVLFSFPVMNLFFHARLKHKKIYLTHRCQLPLHDCQRLDFIRRPPSHSGVCSFTPDTPRHADAITKCSQTSFKTIFVLMLTPGIPLPKSFLDSSKRHVFTD